MSGFAAAQAAAWDAAGRAQQRMLWQGMGAYERHKRLMHDLATLYGGAGQEGAAGAAAAQALPQKTDYDVLREQHRFIRSEADDANDSWEVRLARRYYTKLFKEYAVADLSRHKEGRVGLRWRTQREVVSGKGQFSCGAKGCDERRGLASFEVPFAYEEAGERKQALVKVRVCPTHAYQLHYRKHKEAEEAEEARAERRKQRRERERERSSSGRRKDKRRKRRSGSSKHRGDSGGNGCSSSSDSDSGISGEEGGPRRERKRRRESGHREQEGVEPAAGGAAGAEEEGEQEFDAFLAGLMD